MKLVMELRGTTYPVTVSAVENMFTVELLDRTYIIDVTGAGGRGALSMLVGAESVEAWALANGNGYKVSVLGESFDVEVEDALRAGLKKLKQAGIGAREEEIKAPMPGVVVEVLAEVGAEIDAGQPIVIVEAMKMRNEFGAKHPGKVARLMVKPGQTVERGQTLVLITRETAEAE